MKNRQYLTCRTATLLLNSKPVIANSTVLVLGAGASMDYGFPSGAGLVKQVASRLRGADGLVPLLLGLGHEMKDISAFKEALIGSQAYSVDAFLESREHFIPIGKAAMAYVLKLHEYEKWLDMDDHWYKFLWSRLRTKFDDFGQNKLSIVTYNYDRSLEQFLYTTLMYSLGKQREESITMLKSIPIVHLHGHLGQLSWQHPDNHFDYGKRIKTSDDLLRVAKEIVVIHERTDESEEYAQAQELLKQAGRVYLLGFGFGETNLKRLGLSKLYSGITIRATALGLANVQRQEISKMKLPSIQLYDKDCRRFFDEVPLD